MKGVFVAMYIPKTTDTMLFSMHQPMQLRITYTEPYLSSVHLNGD